MLPTVQTWSSATGNSKQLLRVFNIMYFFKAVFHHGKCCISCRLFQKTKADNVTISLAVLTLLLDLQDLQLGNYDKQYNVLSA